MTSKISLYKYNNDSDGEGYEGSIDNLLDKRELFAIQILNGLFSNSKSVQQNDANHLVEIAVLYADALIKELNKETK